MDIDLIPLIMRWLHVLSAIVAVGGSFFMLFVLRPVATLTLSPADHDSLRTAVRNRWQKYVHVTILLFLISGFYNYLVVMRPQHVDQPVYHMLFGIKFLLALVVFGLAVALTSGKAWSAGMRAKLGTWLGLLVFLAIAIVMISGVMRALPKTVVPPAPLSAPATAESADA